MKGIISMSQKELRRLKIMQRLCDKRLKQKEAALELSLSVRQIKSLYKRYKKYGAKGIISKKRGKPSNHQLPKALKKQALNLILKNYLDFGPTLVHEKLTEKHKLAISVSTVRNIMIQHNIWQSNNKKTRKVYQLRTRRSSIGELIQIDGSCHDWFEGRDSKCTLLAYIDDATGSIMSLKFVKAETTWDNMQTTKDYILMLGDL